MVEAFRSIALRDWELQRVIFATQGGDLPKPFEDDDESQTVEDIRRRAMGDAYNDIVDVAVEGGDSFFDYEVQQL